MDHCYPRNPKAFRPTRARQLHPEQHHRRLLKQRYHQPSRHLRESHSAVHPTPTGAPLSRAFGYDSHRDTGGKKIPGDRQAHLAESPINPTEPIGELRSHFL